MITVLKQITVLQQQTNNIYKTKLSYDHDLFHDLFHDFLKPEHEQDCSLEHRQ